MVVVMLFGVDVSLVGDGGDTTPGQSMCPANVEMVSVRLRMVAAHSRRKVFMCSSMQDSCKQTKFCMDYHLRTFVARAIVSA